MPFVATLVDSPGWGDTLSLKRSFKLVCDHVDGAYQTILREEQRANRRASPWSSSMATDDKTPRAIDVVLYLIGPHRCKGIDTEFLRRLGSRVSIVPVLSKADTMTTAELAVHRREVIEQLEKAGVECAHPPLAVICAPSEAEPVPTDVVRLNMEAGSEPARPRAKALRPDLPWAKEQLGRRYPWGTARSEDLPGHSELPELRHFLLLDGLITLKQATRSKYEAYRRGVLRPSPLVRLRRLLGRLLLLSPLLPTLGTAALGDEKWARLRRQASEALPALPRVRVEWHKLGGGQSPTTSPPRPSSSGRRPRRSWAARSKDSLARVEAPSGVAPAAKGYPLPAAAGPPMIVTSNGYVADAAPPALLVLQIACCAVLAKWM